MTAVITIPKIARRPAAKKAAEVKPAAIRIAHKDVSLDVAPGQYRKVGTRRIGKAFLSVDVNGHLEYANRRGEIRLVNHAEFIQIWRTGISSKVA